MEEATRARDGRVFEDGEGLKPGEGWQRRACLPPTVQWPPSAQLTWPAVIFKEIGVPSASLSLPVLGNVLETQDCNKGTQTVDDSLPKPPICR